MKNNLKVICGTMAGIMIGGITVVGANQAIQAMQNTEIKVSLNGQVQTFKDETTGETQYPITYNNRTYLPLRNVAQLVGLKVDYDNNTNTAILKTNNSPSSNDNLNGSVIKGKIVEASYDNIERDVKISNGKATLNFGSNKGCEVVGLAGSVIKKAFVGSSGQLGIESIVLLCDDGLYLAHANQGDDSTNSTLEFSFNAEKAKTKTTIEDITGTSTSELLDKTEYEENYKVMNGVLILYSDGTYEEIIVAEFETGS